jgi:hypothetical protein
MKPVFDRRKAGAEIDWTPEEFWRLSMLAKKKMSAAKVAKMLGRRVGSVRRQARLLGILLYKR